MAAEVVTKKKEKNETKSENVVEHGSAAIASDSHECGAEREEVDEKLLREKGMRSLGIPFSKSVVVDRHGYPRRMSALSPRANQVLLGSPRMQAASRITPVVLWGALKMNQAE
jgi:hypothetical protein